MFKEINKVVLAVLMAISVIVCAVFFLGGTEDVPTTAGDLEAPVYTSWMLNWSYILFALTAVVTIIFAVMTFVSKLSYDWKSVVVPMISFVVLVVLMLATYFGADTTPINIVGYEGSQEPYIYQITNMCLVSSIILAAIATFVTLFGFLVKKFI